jgi:hypothetical protein
MVDNPTSRSVKQDFLLRNSHQTSDTQIIPRYLSGNLPPPHRALRGAIIFSQTDAEGRAGEFCFCDGTAWRCINEFILRTINIVRQGVDCRSHFGDGGSGLPPTYDWGRDENIANAGMDSARIWTKIGKRVNVKVAMSLIFGDTFIDPTQPAYMYIGFLPFRRNPFNQPPPPDPNPAGDVHGVLGGGILSVYPGNQTQSGMSNYTVTVNVMADFQPRENQDATQPTFGMGPFGPTNGCYFILTSPHGDNGPPPNNRFTGVVEFSYFADDNENIQADGYVPTPGTQCGYPEEYTSLDDPTFQDPTA